MSCPCVSGKKSWFIPLPVHSNASTLWHSMQLVVNPALAWSGFVVASKSCWWHPMQSVPSGSNLRSVSDVWQALQLAVACAPWSGKEFWRWSSVMLLTNQELESWHLEHWSPTDCWWISRWQAVQFDSALANSRFEWHCLQSTDSWRPSSENVVVSWSKETESVMTVQLSDVWQASQLIWKSSPCGFCADARHTARITIIPHKIFLQQTILIFLTKAQKETTSRCVQVEVVMQ